MSSGKNICGNCNKNFSTLGNLNRHLKTSKSCAKIRGEIPKTYDCTFCNKPFTSKDNREKHEKVCDQIATFAVKQHEEMKAKDKKIANLEKEIVDLKAKLTLQQSQSVIIPKPTTKTIVKKDDDKQVIVEEECPEYDQLLKDIRSLFRTYKDPDITRTKEQCLPGMRSKLEKLQKYDLLRKEKLAIEEAKKPPKLSEEEILDKKLAEDRERLMKYEKGYRYVPKILDEYEESKSAFTRKQNEHADIYYRLGRYEPTPFQLRLKKEQDDKVESMRSSPEPIKPRK